MGNRLRSKQGIVLFIVLAAILMIIGLASVAISIIYTQTRLTHHQVSRIQAYYAGLAGINYAFAQLNTGTWSISGTGAAQTLPTDVPFPPSITPPININLIPAGQPDCINPPAGCNCVQVQVVYTYTPTELTPPQSEFFH